MLPNFSEGQNEEKVMKEMKALIENLVGTLWQCTQPFITFFRTFF